MFKNLLKIGLVSTLCFVSLKAGTTNYGSLVCFTKDDYKEYKSADYNIQQNLINKGKCLKLREGLQCSIIKLSMFGASKFKVYVDGNGYEVFGYQACNP